MSLNPFAKYESMVPEIRAAAKTAFDQLVCIYQAAFASWKEQQKTRQILEYQFGRVQEVAAQDQDRIQPRAFTALPEIFEGPTDQRVTIDLEDRLKRLASAGFYANLGDSVFKVILHGLNDKTVEHRVMPGTTIALSAFVTAITIIPVDGEPADYQVYVQ